jgi:hypothetical protein
VRFVGSVRGAIKSGCTLTGALDVQMPGVMRSIVKVPAGGCQTMSESIRGAGITVMPQMTCGPVSVGRVGSILRAYGAVSGSS